MSTEPSSLAYRIARRLRAEHARCEVRACPLSRLWPEDVQEVLVAAATDAHGPLAILDALVGDMAGALQVGGNDDGSLADILARLRSVRALFPQVTVIRNGVTDGA